MHSNKYINNSSARNMNNRENTKMVDNAVEVISGIATALA